MPIDWSATGDMLSGLGTIGGAAAVAWGAHRAADTLRGWKNQKIAERKFEHAERTVIACFNAKVALEHVRGRTLWAHEFSSARKDLEQQEGWALIPEGRRDRLFGVQARFNRLKQTYAEQEELAACIPLAKAMFEQSLETALSNLHRQFWIIRTWNDALAEDEGGDPEFSVKIRRELMSEDPEDSEVTKTIAASLADVDAICLPVLRA